MRVIASSFAAADRQAAGCRRVTPLCVEEECPLRQAFELGWYHDAFVPLGADAFFCLLPARLRNSEAGAQSARRMAAAF
ncbi:hypothetical protein NDS46_15790 [Paenibacillus thiaminolyticus]|uniref:hypothetical protein n=1 Tax=Paenibacillus thiaminolyticus TaxID=49283 RepID=UPI00232ABE26|nr:hypothetical protein [Paenibacillus thiaminolyticus]WCF05851.1 hypothetical protein NDS46_15790 [Paenibacillus thiaminolyticus]